MADAKTLDPKYLAGLKFRSSVPKEVTEDGQKKTRYVPTERDLTADDVISFGDKGDVAVIVTADGRKYEVEKNPKPKPKAEEKAK